jgi:hypothetical protein
VHDLLPLKGRGLDDFGRQIEDVGAARGYEVRRSETAIFLRRKEQSIDVLPMSPDRLGIRVYDGEALPHAKTWEGGIAIGRFSIPLPDGVSIDPGRECEKTGRPHSREAYWHLRGAEAREIVTMIHDYFVQQGLESGGGGAWESGEGGIRWTAEACSAKTLVQAYVLERDEHLDLEIRLIGKDS